MRGRALVAVCVAALACAGASSAARADSPTTQELTITGSGGVQLSCGLVLPGGSPPAGGWPGLVVFPGLSHGVMELLAQSTFAPAGFASLTCDPRGTGTSTGSPDLAGAADVADAQAQFNWLAARPDVSDTEIGAYGETLGGAEALNAAVSGVPFKAFVPVGTWTDLATAIGSPGALKTSLFNELNLAGPPGWDSPAGLAARSSRTQLHSLTVPTLLIQARQDLGLRFDLDQATAAYKLLAGPKRLYVGALTNVGHPRYARPEVVAWLKKYLAGGPAVGNGVEIEHVPADGTTTTFAGLPPTRRVSVNLPGKARLARNQGYVRSVRLPGGPFETFGAGSVTVRYSRASKGWSELVALVRVAGRNGQIIEGATPITATAGVVKIPLLDEVDFLPRGRTIIVTVQSPALPSVFEASVLPADAKVTVKRVTLNLSVLQRAVSR